MSTPRLRLTDRIVSMSVFPSTETPNTYVMRGDIQRGRKRICIAFQIGITEFERLNVMHLIISLERAAASLRHMVGSVTKEAQ